MAWCRFGIWEQEQGYDLLGSWANRPIAPGLTGDLPAREEKVLLKREYECPLGSACLILKPGFIIFELVHPM